MPLASGLPRNISEATTAKRTGLFSSRPVAARRSINFDNGSECFAHDKLKCDLGMQTFFRAPHSPW